MAHEDRKRSFGVQVLAPDYSHVMDTVPAYQTVSATWQYFGAGTGVLVTPERGIALQSLKCEDTVVPITFKAPGLPRWTGRVVNARGVKSSGKVGQLQITLVDEFRFLQRILAPPQPLQPWSNQGLQEHNTRIGGIVNVAKAYMLDNLSRLSTEGYPAPIQVIPLGADSSPQITWRARNHTMEELFKESMQFHGYHPTLTLWLPGDDQPPGLNLTTPTLVFDVVKGRNQPYVRFTDDTGAIESRTLSVSHPQAMGVVIGGPGEGIARQFQKVFAQDGRIADLHGWGWPEVWLDATDAEEPATRTQRGLEKLKELAGTAAVSVEIVDRRPWTAGPSADYWVGDTVRARFSGVAVEDRIDRITVTDNEEGYRVMSTFGASRDTETADQQIARTVSDVARRVAAVEAGR